MKNRWAVLCKKAAHRPSRKSASAASQSPPAHAAVVQPATPQRPPTKNARLSSGACCLALHVLTWEDGASSRLVGEHGVPAHAEPIQPPAQPPDTSCRSVRPATRQRRKPNRGLTITIPQEQPYDSFDSRSSSGRQGPVYIRVHKVTVARTHRPCFNLEFWNLGLVIRWVLVSSILSAAHSLILAFKHASPDDCKPHACQQ